MTLRRQVTLRLRDLRLELTELGNRQAAIFVVVESSYEVQCAVWRVVEFLTQDGHRVVERNKCLASETTKYQWQRRIQYLGNDGGASHPISLFTFSLYLHTIDVSITSEAIYVGIHASYHFSSFTRMSGGSRPRHGGPGISLTVLFN